MLGLIALVVAVITGKRLLPGVRSCVFSEIVSSYARIVALTTLKRLLARMSEHVGFEDGIL